MQLAKKVHVEAPGKDKCSSAAAVAYSLAAWSQTE